MSSNLSATPFKLPQTSEAWADLFLKSCKSGDLSVVKKLCSPELKAIADIHAENELGFRLACGNGYLEIVKFLTTSKELIKAGHSFVDIHAENEDGFRWACNCGHLDVVKFLTTSKDLLAAGHTFVDIHSENERGFRGACINGHLEIIKFLTTDPKLLEAGHTFVNIHTFNEWGFIWACRNGQFEVVKFLTTSPELLSAGHTFVDIHSENEQGFQLACENHHWNVVQFLIFELKIERTSAIDIIIKKYPKLQELFKVHEEHKRFQQSLNESHLTLQNPHHRTQEIKSAASFRI